VSHDDLTQENEFRQGGKNVAICQGMGSRGTGNPLRADRESNRNSCSQAVIRCLTAGSSTGFKLSAPS